MLTRIRFRSNIPRSTSNCESPDPESTLTGRLNTLLNSSGPGYTLSLCPSQQYIITAPLLFAAPNQEISTAGYPTDSTRATLVVNGPVANGTGHTTAVDGTCASCDGVKLRNVQVTLFLFAFSSHPLTRHADQWHTSRCAADNRGCKHRNGWLECQPGDRVRSLV